MTEAECVVRAPESTSRVFRGWYVVAALFACAFIMYGAGMYSFMLFVRPISERFHWGPAATGGLVSAFWVTAPLSLLTDRLIRHFGLKRLVTSGIVIEAAALICLFTASHLWEMYLLRVLAGLGKVLLAITLPIIVSKWFSRRFGTAMALVYSGWFFSGIVFAPAAHFLIHAIGWRAASTVLGVVVLVALPPALWMLRVESATDIGLGTDGDPLPIATSVAKPAIDDHRTVSGPRPVRSSLWRRRPFQLIAVSRTFYYLIISGPFVYQTAIVGTSGAFVRTASVLLGFTAASIGTGELLSGYLVDRLSWIWAMAIQFVLLGIGVSALLIFTHHGSGWWLAVNAVCFGLAYGGSDPFWTTTLKRRVPAEQFQQAWGPIYFLGLTASVVWPLCFGWLRDLSGGYVVPLATSLALVAVPLSLSLTVPMRRE